MAEADGSHGRIGSNGLARVGERAGGRTISEGGEEDGAPLLLAPATVHANSP